MKRWILVALAVAFSMRPAMAQRHPSLPALAVPNGAGVNIHFTDPRPGEMKMLAQSFRWVRMDFVWGGTERVKGQYDFSAYDRLLKALEEHRVRALFILDYGNDLYDNGLSPHTDEGRQAMARWAAAAVTHFKGRGVLWEMWNEPNIGFWKPTPKVDDYILLARAVAKSIRAAAPGECHFGAATSQVDLKFLEACFKAGLLEQWDAVSVHPYRQNDPETASGELRALRMLIERYKPRGKQIPILSGEWGYSTAWDKFSDERQGTYLPRQWMTNLMNDVPLSIWYDWHDDGLDPREPEHHFGTVEHEFAEGSDPYKPKPSFLAARAFSQTFNGLSFNKRLSLASPDDYVLLFAKNGTVKISAWTTSAKARSITIPTSPGFFRVTNYLGQVQPQQRAEKSGLTIRVTDAPLYLEPIAPNALLAQLAAWKRLPLEIMVKAPAPIPALESSRLTTITWMGRDTPPAIRREVLLGAMQTTDFVVTNPLTIAVSPGPDDQMTIDLQNPLGDAFAGTLSTSGGASKSVVFARGETEKTVSLPRPATGADGSWKAALHFQGTRREDVVDVVRSFRALDDLARHADINKALRVVPDGDARIASEQALSLAQPPGGASPGGGASLKLNYRMEAGWKFLQIQPILDDLRKVEGRPRALGMWVYGDGSSNLLRMRFRDASGQTWQPGGAPIDWKGWRFYQFPIDTKASSWGGDGQLHWPITLDTLALLDSDSKTDNKGEVYFAAPVWIY